MPLYPSDEGKGIARIDNIVRINAGASEGSLTTARRTAYHVATKIVLSPVNHNESVDARYLSDLLQSVPVISGDIVLVPYVNRVLLFEVKSATPDGAVFIHERSKIEIEE